MLAIAAARALRQRVLATDIDASAVRVARANARLNRAGDLVEFREGRRRHRAGVPRTRAPFDLVFANILLGPLQRLAAPLKRLIAPGGRVVLSGIVPRRPMPRSPPIAPLALERRIDLDGWTTLVLARRCSGASVVAGPPPTIHTLPRMFEAHFQSFEDRSERGASAPRVAALRAELERRGLDGFIVPRADRYQNEYVPPCAERLAWLTGFTGSAGLAIVLADRAVHLRRRPLSGAGAR